MKNLHKLSAGAAAILLLGGCASGAGPAPSTGERISQRGSDIGAYGDSWTDGQRDVAAGTKAVQKSERKLADSEKDLARARQDVARAEDQIRTARASRTDAEAMIVQGRNQMERAEADYSDIRQGPPAVSQPN